MKILVTGAAGFIGAHLTRALTQAGHTVIGLDDFNETVYPAEIKRARVMYFQLNQGAAKLIEGSILNQDVLEKIFHEHHPKAVIHLAALANPGLSVGMPEKYFMVNVEGTKNVLAAAGNARVSQIIFAGSSSVYNDESVPFREDSYPLRPRSPYGESKAQAETVFQQWHEHSKIPVMILRFFSVYGPWGRPDMAPMVFARKILQGEPIELTRESRLRDFTYIDDTVSGIIAAIQHPFPFEIINLGRGNPMTLQQLVGAIEAAAGKPARIVLRDAPSGEMQQTFADSTKARRLLHFEPKVLLPEGAEKLVEWVREYDAIA